MSDFHYYKKYDLADGLSYAVDVAQQKSLFAFRDVAASELLFGLGISHIYRYDRTIGFSVGTGFGLNIIESFKINSDDSYTYTDYLGDSYSLVNGLYKDMWVPHNVPPIYMTLNPCIQSVLYFNDNHPGYVGQPVNWLENGDVIKAFDAYGKLVLIGDKNGNFYHIVYRAPQSSTVAFPAYIKQVPTSCLNYDSAPTVLTFVANNNLLSQITGQNGNVLATYTYFGAALASATVCGVTYNFTYGAGGALTGVQSSNGIHYGISTTGYYINSTLSQVPNGSSQTGAIIESETISYSGTNATITDEDGNVDAFECSLGNNNTIVHYHKERGLIIAAEKYVFDINSRIVQYNKAPLKNLGGATLTNADLIDGEYETTCYTEKKVSSRESRRFAYSNVPSTTTREQETEIVTYITTQETYHYDSGDNLTYVTKTTTIPPIGSGTNEVINERTDYSYDSYGRVTSIVHYKVGGETRADVTEYEYPYDAEYVNSKVTKYNRANTAIKTITQYDEYGRLISETDVTGRTKQYVYYEGTCKLWKIIEPGNFTRTFEYNNAGNVTSYKFNSAFNGALTYTSGELTGESRADNAFAYTYDGMRRIKSASLNSGMTEQYAYVNTNSNGYPSQRKVTTTYASGNISALTRDCAAYTDHILWNGDETFSVTTNAVGEMVAQHDYVTGRDTTYEYNSIGKLLAVNNSYPDVSETYTYNKYGYIATITYSGGYICNISNTYSGGYNNRLTEVRVGNYVSQPIYDSTYRNAGKTVTLSPALYTDEISYGTSGNGLGLPKKISHMTRRGGAVMTTGSVEYTYNAAGKIIQVTRKIGSNQKDTSYEYDTYGRLTRENNQLLNKTCVYEYNSNGNRSLMVELPYTTSSVSTHSGSRTTYSYSGGKLTSIDGVTMSYDNDGNQLYCGAYDLSWTNGKLTRCGRNLTFSYDGQGRLIRHGGTSLTYDSNGRILKSSNGMQFFYDQTGLLGFMYNNSKYVYQKDLLGNIIAIYDADGNVAALYEYDAWGRSKTYTLNGTTITVNTSATHIGNINPFRYRGYYYDAATGLYWLQTRFYDPETGRFISPDSYSYVDASELYGLNLYTYCGNNPVMNIDPTGHGVVAVLIALAISATVGGVVGGINSVATGGSFWSGFWGGAISGVISAVGTAVGFAIGGGFGAISAFVGGFVGGVAGGAVQHAINNDWNSFAIADILFNGLIDGLFNVLSYGISYMAFKGSGGIFKAKFWERFIDALQFNPYTNLVGGVVLGFPTSLLSIVPNAFWKKYYNKYV